MHILKKLLVTTLALATTSALANERNLNFTPKVRAQAEETVAANPAAPLAIKDDNLVVLRGPIDGDPAVLLKILSIKSNEAVMFINSPGGSVMDAFDIIGAMKSSGKHFTCVAQFAASAAFMILQACDTRIVLPTGLIMQHQMSFGLRQQSAANQLNFIDFIVRMNNEADVAQAERLGLSVEDFQAKIHDDWWLFGNEALKANAVDKVGYIQCSPELTQSTTVSKVNFFGNIINLTWSKCPLIPEPLSVAVESTVRRDVDTVTLIKDFLKSLNTVQTKNGPVDRRDLVGGQSK